MKRLKKLVYIINMFLKQFCLKSIAENFCLNFEVCMGFSFVPVLPSLPQVQGRLQGTQSYNSDTTIIKQI